jgi:hypothetical protein
VARKVADEGADAEARTPHKGLFDLLVLARLQGQRFELNPHTLASPNVVQAARGLRIVAPLALDNSAKAVRSTSAERERVQASTCDQERAIALAIADCLVSAIEAEDEDVRTCGLPSVSVGAGVPLSRINTGPAARRVGGGS